VSPLCGCAGTARISKCGHSAVLALGYAVRKTLDWKFSKVSSSSDSMPMKIIPGSSINSEYWLLLGTALASADNLESFLLSDGSGGMHE
jgi:hypothetical protein